MKIVLISLYGIESIGVRILFSFLKTHGFDVSIIFLKKWVNNNISEPSIVEEACLVKLLKNISPALVGLSFGTSYFNIAKKITFSIKSNLDSMVVWGGVHATIVPEECIDFADIVCVGEGEYPLLELAKQLAMREEISNIQNLWIRNDNHVEKNGLRKLVNNLDELPFPNLENDNKFYIENNRVYEGDPLYKSAEYRIIASRGCLFNCSYCYNSTLRKIYKEKGNYFRQRSPENVVAELEYAIKTIPRLRKIKFDDDTFIFPNEWIDKFCSLYKKRINIPFDILLNPLVIDESVLLKLKDAGLRGVQIGIQTSAEGHLKEVYQRSASNEKIVKFSQINRKLKLDVVYDIILDDPTATVEEKKELFVFLMSLSRPFKLFLYSLTFFPKTDISNRFLEMGIIDKNDIEGAATKTFNQYRLSMAYPRSKEDIFFISLIVLITKNFIPKAFIYRIYRNKFLRKHPYFLKIFSQLCNFIKIVSIAFKMFVRGELTFLKIKEYLNVRKLLTQ